MEKGWRFYRGGLCFECQGDGKCCRSTGARQFVYLTREDRRRLAARLEVSTRSFTRRYCQKTDGLFHLKNPELDCCFLEGNRCAVYEDRPDQCRTWPFWPENLDPDVWREEVLTFCPGAGKGRRYSCEEIEELAERAARITR